MRKVPVGLYSPASGVAGHYPWVFELKASESTMDLTVITHLENRALHLTMSRTEAANLAKAILQTLSEEE